MGGESVNVQSAFLHLCLTFSPACHTQWTSSELQIADMRPKKKFHQLSPYSKLKSPSIFPPLLQSHQLITSAHSKGKTFSHSISSPMTTIHHFCLLSLFFGRGGMSIVATPWAHCHIMWLIFCTHGYSGGELTLTPSQPEMSAWWPATEGVGEELAIQQTYISLLCHYHFTTLPLPTSYYGNL